MSYLIYDKTSDTFNTVAGRTGDAISKVITRTLSAGDTEITITDETISDEAIIEIYTDKYGVSPSDVNQDGTTLTLTFDAQEEDLTVKVTLGLHAYTGDVVDSLEECIDSASNGKPAGSKALEQLVEYSTEEVAIGKWIDGKTIYRRVFQTTMPTSANSDAIIYTFTDTIIPINIYGACIESSGSVEPINYWYSTSFYIATWLTGGKNLKIRANGSGYLNNNKYVVVEYIEA